MSYIWNTRHFCLIGDRLLYAPSAQSREEEYKALAITGESTVAVVAVGETKQRSSGNWPLLWRRRRRLCKPSCARWKTK